MQLKHTFAGSSIVLAVVVQPNGGPPSPVTPVSAALAVPPATSASPVWAALQAAVRWLRSPLFRANKSTLLHPTSPQPSREMVAPLCSTMRCLNAALLVSHTIGPQCDT